MSVLKDRGKDGERRLGNKRDIQGKRQRGRGRYGAGDLEREREQGR